MLKILSANREGFIRDTIVSGPPIVPLEKAEGHDFQKNRVPRSQGHDKGHDTENRVPDRVPNVPPNRVPGGDTAVSKYLVQFSNL